MIIGEGGGGEEDRREVVVSLLTENNAFKTPCNLLFVGKASGRGRSFLF